MNMSKIAVFMSGGVDSTLAALLLKEQGHTILGVTALLIPDEISTTGNSCCDEKDIQDARDIALKHNFPHKTIDLTDTFKKYVIDNLYRNYIQGMTPNPCARCNESVKVTALQRITKEMDYPFFSTGHYSRIEQDNKTGRFFLKATFDDPKDQSYFLFTLSQETLSSFILPLSGLNKKAVRKLAQERGLILDNTKESQDICFIPDNDYKKFLTDNYNIKPRIGNVLDISGKAIGKHDGIWNFTVGQRKGLGINSNTPLYVIKIDSKNNSITVGPEKELYRSNFTVSRVNLMKMDKIHANETLIVKIRSTSPPLPCSIITQSDHTIKVSLKSPGRAITPGQAAVFYNQEGDLLFGGWIDPHIS